MRLRMRFSVWIATLAAAIAVLMLAGVAYHNSGTAGAVTPNAGDGLDDVFFYNSSANTGRVKIANGDGTWTTFAQESDLSSDWQIYPGYFNSDTLEDMFLYNDSGGIAVVLFSNGNGTWTQGTVDHVFGTDWSIATGNFNDDSITDILAVRYNGSNTSTGVVVHSDSQGNLTSDSPDSTSFSFPNGSSLELLPGRFNSDNLTDVFVFQPITGAARTLYANGDGGWTADSGTQANASYRDLYVGDFNGDGIDDLFWHYGYMGSYATGEDFKNSGAGWSVAPESCSDDEADVQLFPGNYNDDNITDLFRYTSADQLSETEISDGMGCFASSGPNDTNVPSVVSIYPGPFNHDPLTDLLVYDSSTGDAQIMTLSGLDWVLGPLETFPLYPNELILGDFGASPYTPTPSPTPSPTLSAAPTPSRTPTPAASHSPTVTPTPMSTPVPTPSPTVPARPVQGDTDCSGDVTVADAGDLIAYIGLHDNGPASCLSAHISSVHVFADVNCDGGVTVLDVLDILLHLVGVPEVGLVSGCPNVGQNAPN